MLGDLTFLTIYDLIFYHTRLKHKRFWFQLAVSIIIVSAISIVPFFVESVMILTPFMIITTFIICIVFSTGLYYLYGAPEQKVYTKPKKSQLYYVFFLEGISLTLILVSIIREIIKLN